MINNFNNLTIFVKPVSLFLKVIEKNCFCLSWKFEIPLTHSFFKNSFPIQHSKMANLYVLIRSDL